MDTNKRLLLLELADCVLRSWWTVVAGVCLGLAAALLSLQNAPKIFEATADINLSLEKLPPGLVADIVMADPETQLRELRRNVFSERYLDKIIADMFAPPRTAEERDALLGQIRSGVRVGRPGWTDHFLIGYRDTDPVRAARIANALAEFYVSENVKYRVGKAGDAVDTLKSLADQLRERIRAKKRETAQYKAQHPYRTEADRSMNLEVLEQSRKDLRANLDEQAYVQQELELLEVQREQDKSMGPYAPDPGIGSTVLTDPLRALEAELGELLTKYSEDHPAVREKRTQIEERRKRFQQHPPAAGEPAESPGVPGYEAGMWDARIRTAQSILRGLEETERNLRASIAEYARRLEDTPVVERRLDELSGDIPILEKQYAESLAAVIEAENSQRVEQQGGGKQFEIITAASAPSKPVFPSALLFYGTGIGLGLLLFVGPVLARHLLIPIIGSEARLARVSDVPVLVTVPSIPTPAMARRRRRLRLRNAMLSLLAVAMLVAVVGLRGSGLL